MSIANAVLDLLFQFEPHNCKQLLLIQLLLTFLKLKSWYLSVMGLEKSFTFHFPGDSKYSVTGRIVYLPPQESEQITNLFKHNICHYKYFTACFVGEIK